MPREIQWPAELVAELVTEPMASVHSAPLSLDARRRPWPIRWMRAIWHAVAATLHFVFGLLSLILGLAVLAAIPLFQFLSLGYLLEAGGRIARTGRFREGFIGIDSAARVGGIVLGTWLVSWPLWLMASYWRTALLIDPEGGASLTWGLGFVVLLFATSLHIVRSLMRGGKLRHFAWPFFSPRAAWRRLRQGGQYIRARDGVYEFIVSLRLPYYFWLGLRGFAGAFLWLTLPVTILALGRQAPAGIVLGAPLLAIVALYLPLLQMHFAKEQRFGAMFEWRAAHRIFARAPLASWLATAATLLLALPLYLLKIEMIPREAVWLPSLFFVTFMLPARWLAGWAYALGLCREKPRFILWRWFWRVLLLPPVALYVLIAFFSQYTAWYGVWSLYEQHAFLLPVPFLGMPS